MSAGNDKPPGNLDGGGVGATGFLASFSPWASRSTTPRSETPSTKPKAVEIKVKEPPQLSPAHRVDHAVSRINRLSKKEYPPDCPPINVRWYHAVDVPKRKPFSSSTSTDVQKPEYVPRKYISFSVRDSKAIEAAFQRLSETHDESERNKLFANSDERPSTSRNLGQKDDLSSAGEAVLVPVNEDYLFDVDVERRELAPAYWLGPIYDVRRGTWFSASDGVPCDENLATQLEEGYMKIQPWKGPNHGERSVSQTRGRTDSIRGGEQVQSRSLSRPSTPKRSADITLLANQSDAVSPENPNEPSPQTSVRSFRLFGSHMNSLVTYEDATTAYIVTDDLYSRMSGTVYERIGGGAHRAGMKVIRGYQELPKKVDGVNTKVTEFPAKGSHSRTGSQAKVEQATHKPSHETDITDAVHDKLSSPTQETPRQKLERQMSTLVGSFNQDQEEEEVRKRDEEEMREDYNEEYDEQGREIEHLILITHGIGQRLGLRLESINFIHDVNTLRKTMKSVYNDSTDLQALNSERDQPIKNCRIQVLPICWRHLLDFPKQSLKHNRKEHDLGDAIGVDDEEYPTLEDITIKGVPAIRNLITDLGLDILLYQSPVYKAHISKIVLEECNRIYRLFKQRNPHFKGKISLLGHSLGSAVMFDILCNQKIDNPQSPLYQSTRFPNNGSYMQLDFDVEDFYAFGSPVGLFQMLKGRTIAARQAPNVKPAQTPFGGPQIDPFANSIEITTSSPRCKQIFNIFHPTDPIAYRMEPLISPAMANLNPQPLPYTKKGIFGAPAGQGFTGIGARVGQSMSGLWSSFSSGIATSLLNRSLGISTEEANRLGNPMPQALMPKTNLSAKVSAAAGGATEMANLNTTPLSVEDAKKLLAENYKTLEKGDEGENPPTLLNAGLETLFSGFQKQQGPQDGSEPEETEEDVKEEKAAEERKVWREESKLRALNKNGRVDYNIQEGAFDISILASIASHLAYWADEDVSHFMVSQILSRQRVLKSSETKNPR